MKKILITALLLVGITATAQVKVGSNPTTLATNAAGTADDANFQVEGETASGNKQFVILQNGNVGIGTTTPAEALELGNGNQLQLSSNSSSSNVGDIIFYEGHAAIEKGRIWTNGTTGLTLL